MDGHAYRQRDNKRSIMDLNTSTDRQTDRQA